MSQPSSIPVLLITFLELLTGCQFSVSAGVGKKRAAAAAAHTAPTDGARIDTESEPDQPPIRGEWSEPVNGIRMMAQQIVQQGGSPELRDSITLIVFAWNTTGQRVAMPPIMAEREVGYVPEPGYEPERHKTSGNLLVTAKPLERWLPDRHRQNGGLDEFRGIRPLLEPGEVRLHALHLRLVYDQLQEEMQQLAKIQDNTIPASRVDWHEPRGEYILHLTYRPEGFNDQDSGAIHRIEDVAGWEGKQIDLPPIVVRVSDPREARR